MLPPYVPTANRTDRGAASEATLLPPLRLAGARTRAPTADRVVEPLDEPTGEIQWIGETLPADGQIDELPPDRTETDDRGFLDSTFGAIDLSDEWETDQLASLDDGEEVGAESADPAEAKLSESPPPEAAAGEPLPERGEMGASAFESDAEMFVKLLDELEAAARAESAKLDADHGVERVSLPRAPERPPMSIPVSVPDARRVEEIASRLERIARSLRERGPAGPLADEGADPLGAMVAGYLLGLSERSLGAEVRDPIGPE